MVGLLRSYPCTILMLAILAMAAVGSGSHVGPLSPSLRRTLGFAPLHLPKGELSRMLTSVFLTVGGVKFYASAIMLAAGLGVAEKLFGSVRAMALFWGVHLTTLVVASVVLTLPLHALNFHRGTLLASARDVGPSAGYYGCLGAACNALPGKWRMALISIVLTVLLARFIWSFATVPDHGRALSSDLSHLIAFPLGVLAGVWLRSDALAQP